MGMASQVADKVIFKQAAVDKVYELIKDEGNYALNLRVFISGGGCSGFQYGFTFDEKINPDDTVVEKVPSQVENDETIKLLVDVLSVQYLTGAEVDYREDINGAQFIIRNPNAKTTCGCGSSFSV